MDNDSLSTKENERDKKNIENTHMKPRKTLRAYLYKLKIHPYYYVPPCPSCGSPVTGRYMQRPNKDDDRDFVVRQTLGNGEIISLVDVLPEDDLFCIECDYTWIGKPEFKLLSRDDIEEQKEIRGTQEVYDEFMMERKKQIGAKTSTLSGQVAYSTKKFFGNLFPF